MADIVKRNHLWQDIHSNDSVAWKQGQSDWRNNLYGRYLNNLKNADLNLKWIDADSFNQLTSDIVDLEEYDVPFDRKVPILSRGQPIDKYDSQIWFQLYEQPVLGDFILGQDVLGKI